jgi:hypothetical protein
MVGAMSLSILGHSGKLVPNHFLGQDGDAAQLAIFFPGLGYTCDMPAFYYTQNMLEESADLLRVEYAYGPATSFKNIAAIEQFAPLFDDAMAAWNAVRNERPYLTRTLIGKSLGTMAIGQILAANPSMPDLRVIWLTPLLRSERLFRQMQAFRGRSLIVIGTEDAHYDPALLASLRETSGTELLVVEGADHGFDIPGDITGSVEALGAVVTAVERFLQT